MQLEDLVKVIPQLLLLYVPGYISMEIERCYGLKKRKSEFDVAIYSILYSFLIQILYELLRTYCRQWLIPLWRWVPVIIRREAGMLLLGVVLGCILAKIAQGKLGRWFGEKINEKLDPATSVWYKAMENHENGVWVRVYLKNNMVYTGKLIYYTSDPDGESRDLLLSNYRMSLRNPDASQEKDFRVTIDDMTKDSNAKVFLTEREILTVELFE